MTQVLPEVCPAAPPVATQRYVPKPLTGVLHWGIWDDLLGGWCTLADRFCLIPLEWKTKEEAEAWLYQCEIVWRSGTVAAPAGWDSL